MQTVKTVSKMCVAAGLAASFALSSSASVLNAGDSFTTVFGVVPGPTPSAAAPGQLAADVGVFPGDAVLNGLEEFTSFNVQNNNDGTLLAGSSNTGQVLFFQNGGFYVGGAGPAASNPLTAQGEINLGGPQVNNRAYGVFGTGRSDFVFETGVVSDVLLQVRGTADGLNIGGNSALGQSLPENAPLADAEATVLIYTDLGLQATTTVSNLSFETLSLSLGATVDGQILSGDSITRISLVNQGPTNSAVVLGELTATVVPEPASLMLLMAGGTMMLVRRRSSQTV